MAPFSTRVWLALVIGCAPEDLSIIERSTDERFTSFALHGRPHGQVHLTEPQGQFPWSQARQALIAAWTGGTAHRLLLDDDEVTW